MSDDAWRAALAALLAWDDGSCSQRAAIVAALRRLSDTPPEGT